MKKLADAVISESRFIALISLLLSLLMQGIFLMIGKWSPSVLWGNLLGAGVAVGNFFLMAVTVQIAVEKDEKEAKNTLKLSQSLRFLMLIVFAVVAYLLPAFHMVAFILPYLFPRIAIVLRPLFIKD